MKKKPVPQIISQIDLWQEACLLAGHEMKAADFFYLPPKAQDYWHDLAVWIHNKVTK